MSKTSAFDYSGQRSPSTDRSTIEKFHNPLSGFLFVFCGGSGGMVRIRSNQKFIVITVVIQVTKVQQASSSIFEREEGCQAIQSTIYTSVEYLIRKSFHSVITILLGHGPLNNKQTS